MKITGIQVHIVHAYRTNWVFVKVQTDEGIHGVGEATQEMRELTVATAVQELERTLKGRDPFDTEAIWHNAYRDTYFRGGPVLMSALSAIDMALWDIKGKKLGLPVYQLLGGKVRDRIRCYANGWFAPAKTPEEFAAKAKAAVADGWTALKWDPFGSSYMNITGAELRDARACIRAVRDAVGEEVDLLIEGHGRFNVASAVRIAKMLADFDVLWFEEPLPPDNLRAMALLAKTSPVNIAVGERAYHRWDVREILRLQCAAFIQPDVSHAGGISEMRKIAAMAEADYVGFCPHNPSGPIANAATLQLAACTPNFFLLETMSVDVPWRRDLTSEQVRLERGEMLIPSLPGLGIDLKEDAFAAHPYQPRELRHYAGNLTDIRPPDAVGIGGRPTGH